MKRLFIIFSIIFVILIARFVAEHEMTPASLDDRPKLESLRSFVNQEIYGERIVKGEFQSDYDNLGIIGIRFETFYRLNTDTLEFRIREKGEKDWYYIGRYKTDQFQTQRIFPFGFPAISKSKGNTYQFELRSLDGMPENAVGISGTYPNFVGRHVFSKKELLMKWWRLPFFIKEKIVNLYEYPDLLLSSLIYATPLFFLILFWFTNGSLLASLFALFLLIKWDVFFNRQFFDYLFASAIFCWLYIVWQHRLAKTVSAAISLALWGVVVALVFTGDYLVVEKATSWAVIFLLVSFFQQFIGSDETYSRGRKYIFQKSISEIKAIPLTSQQIKKKYRTSHFISGIACLFILHLWLIWGITSDFVGVVKSFINFFPDRQIIRFLTVTGIYLFLLYTVAIAILVASVRKFKSMSPYIISGVILILVSFVQSIIISASNPSSSPVIWSAKGFGLREPWVDIFIDGRNFYPESYKGKVTIDNVEQRIIKWTDREIIFRTDPYVTRSGKLTVTRNDSKKSNSVDFLYYGNQ